MSSINSTPLIVQSDGSLLLDVHDPGFSLARDDIAPFAELEKSPEHMHTYRISPISLWNAASAGLREQEIEKRLKKWSRFPVPDNVLFNVRDLLGRYGSIVLEPSDDPAYLVLKIASEALRRELIARRDIMKLLVPLGDDFMVSLVNRGSLKSALIRINYPVDDRVPLREGEKTSITLRTGTSDGRDFTVRDYQAEAAECFHGGGLPGNGFGVIVLPCGAGKTIVGLKVMELLQTSTLIVTTNVAAVHQWMDELKDKTELDHDEIGEYTSGKKEIRPVTVTTYQILSYGQKQDPPFPHFALFRARDWGLIIYDEVHLLPAPVFRVTAEIQAVRRLGLTATLVREDGKEGEVFSLIGPKRYDVPWKELEQKGWIAEAYCTEIRIDLPEDDRIPYATADKRRKYRIAAENSRKIEIARELAANHAGEGTLVIGQYIDQLTKIAAAFKAPLITGKTPNSEREDLYRRFRSGEITILVVSKVANFAIDLPDASVAIQVSGTFGSRQEEAQRLGRILRPKARNSYFYSLVSRYTLEEEYALNRQKFLTEQGYGYHIELWDTDI
ncbi:DNA repair helicase XPB [Marispirochaeta aestuarii]|uniref:DNA repair helicase XPB n=1 Tax=Marispirochaeta aestuarii TaxID=1963862 RepID=UPI0029C6096B|nr:DNA repair helicase XPB [Marispirochaeta aestuarii]